MKKSVKIILILILAGIVIGGGGVYYVFNKPHRNIEKEKVAFNMTPSELFAEYSANEEASNAKFIGQIINVKGEIVELSKTDKEVSIVLGDAMEGVTCALDSAAIVANKDKIAALAEGQTVSLKGKCDGMDMIMGVVLTRCYFTEEKK